MMLISGIICMGVQVAKKTRKPPRPGPDELTSIVIAAQKAVKEGRKGFASEDDQVEMLTELELSNEQFWECISKSLDEILSAGPKRSYRGEAPPRKAKKPGIYGDELWAFACSTAWGNPTYLKFVLPGQDFYVHVRMHPDDPNMVKREEGT